MNFSNCFSCLWSGFAQYYYWMVWWLLVSTRSRYTQCYCCTGDSSCRPLYTGPKRCMYFLTKSLALLRTDSVTSKSSTCRQYFSSLSSTACVSYKNTHGYTKVTDIRVLHLVLVCYWKHIVQRLIYNGINISTTACQWQTLCSTDLSRQVFEILIRRDSPKLTITPSERTQELHHTLWYLQQKTPPAWGETGHNWHTYMQTGCHGITAINLVSCNIKHVDR